MVVVVGAGVVVVVVAGGAVVVVVVGAWYATRCDRRFTPSRCDAACTADACAPWTMRAAATDCGAVVPFNNRRGAKNSAPQMTAATPRRLPLVLWFRRAPPFSGDTVHPRRHTGGEGFLKKLDNQTRATQTRKRTKPFRALFPLVRTPLSAIFR